jgi:dihydroneopterin aldolase
MKHKFNKDHYQSQNEARKSALHILQGLLLKCHINFKKKLEKLEIYTTSTYAILASTLKKLAQKFNFRTLIRRCQRLLNGILTFLKHLCACGLGEHVAWHLAGKGEVGLTLRKEEVLSSISFGGD